MHTVHQASLKKLKSRLPSQPAEDCYCHEEKEKEAVRRNQQSTWRNVEVDRSGRGQHQHGFQPAPELLLLLATSY